MRGKDFRNRQPEFRRNDLICVETGKSRPPLKTTPNRRLACAHHSDEDNRSRGHLDNMRLKTDNEKIDIFCWASVLDAVFGVSQKSPTISLCLRRSLRRLSPLSWVVPRIGKPCAIRSNFLMSLPCLTNIKFFPRIAARKLRLTLLELQRAAGCA